MSLFARLVASLIPQPDASADMVSAFSLFTHLLHAETYVYLGEAARVLKAGGRIVFSFLEFAEPDHWGIFIRHCEANRLGAADHLDQFIERQAIEVWAARLGLVLERLFGSGEPLADGQSLGQATAVLRKP